jgi:hypothetical protein
MNDKKLLIALQVIIVIVMYTTIFIAIMLLKHIFNIDSWWAITIIWITIYIPTKYSTEILLLEL